MPSSMAPMAIATGNMLIGNAEFTNNIWVNPIYEMVVALRLKALKMVTSSEDLSERNVERCGEVTIRYRLHKALKILLLA